MRSFLLPVEGATMDGPQRTVALNAVRVDRTIEGGKESRSMVHRGP
jgi:hypothetical protein